MLAAANLSAPEREEISTAFLVLNALQFAHKLHELEIPDKAKSELLALKVHAPLPPKEDLMQTAIARAMDRYWARLSAGKV